MELSQASGAATCTAVVVTSALVAAGVAAFSSGALSRTATSATAGERKEATNSRSDAASAKASKAMDGVVPWLPAEIATSFDDFPFFLNKKTRELLTASAGRTFLSEGASKRSHSITVRGPEGSVRYQAELCKGLAKKFDAALFILDASFVHLISQSSYWRGASSSRSKPAIWTGGSGFAYFTEKGDAAATLQAISKASRARPVICLVACADGCAAALAQTLAKRVDGPHGVLVVASCTAACEDVHAASYSDVEVRAPKESEKVRAWEAMLKEQSHYMVCERNLQAIFLALKARKVTWDEDVADARFNFTASLAPHEVQDIINMALSEQMLAGRTNAQLHVTRDRLEYSLSLFFDEDGACHEKTAVTNGQVVQGKEPVAVHKAVLRVGIPKGDEGGGSKVGTPRADAVRTPRAADALAAKLASPKVATPKKPAPAPAPAAASDDNDFEKRIRPEILAPGSIGVTFESIGALESVKESLRELVLVPLKHPEIFNKGGLLQACKGILLFGPPGTGKTMLAKAVATECGASFINVSMSTITSKWFGEDEKNVRALFTLAEKVAPTVIFIDEVDSMLGQRKGAGEHEAMRKIKNEFMTHWDGLASKAGSRVLVLAATNRPFDLDEAIIRRFQRRIMVGLPDADNRELILRSILKHEQVDADVDYCELAQLTEGFSGSDLKTLCTAAAYGVLREALAAADGSAREEALKLRPLTLEDFREGKTQVSASVAGEAQSMQELKEWNNLYGEGGNRKKATLSYFL
ncbi:unnamed protein product [Closterium sp. Naga37s-1]|nr:unnamed protein product [Closterium sp. Naga37s-1]